MNRAWRPIELQLADITTLDVDCIVNAANESLLGGGGVDGAVHDAAGPWLLKATRAIGGCPTGEARITPGFNLKARWIIHTVGPVWHGGNRKESHLLASCYRSVFAIAENPAYGIHTIAFPAISAGVYGYPPQLAAEIALNEIDRVTSKTGQFTKVIIACFSGEMLNQYLDVAPGILE